MSAAIHLQPTAPLAERVLLPGDPGRALRLAQTLLEGPRMFNHNRGLWGYSGTAHDGEALTIQSTGMGGPSIAIVAEELISLGARRLIRVGTCGALDESLELGQLVVASEALAADGTSRALGAGERVAPDAGLLTGLCVDGARSALVVTSDLFYDERDGVQDAWARAGVAAIEMEAATLLALAAKRGVAAAVLLIVSDLLVPTRTRIEGDALYAAERRAGEAALRALAPG